MAFLKKLGKVAKVAKTISSIPVIGDVVGDIIPDEISDNIEGLEDLGVDGLEDVADTLQDALDNVSDDLQDSLEDKESLIEQAKGGLSKFVKNQNFLKKKKISDLNIPHVTSTHPIQSSEPTLPVLPELSIYAAIDNEQHGPYDALQFKRLIENQMINSSTLVWQNGMDGWLPAGQAVPEFFNLGNMPPIPHPASGVVFTTTNHVDIPEGIECLEEDYEIDDNVESITLPSTIKEIEYGVISEKKWLKQIDFSRVTQLRTITECLFTGCRSLEEIIVPEGVLEIEYGAFEGCTSLRRIVLPSTLQDMSQLADKGLKNLKIIDFSKVYQLRTIPEYCFAGCNNLEEIIIPEGVEEVGEEAFDGCKNLKRIIVPSTLNDVQNIPANLIVFNNR